MIRAINRNTTASMALCVGFLCGSPALFAQEATVAPVAEPVPVVQITPTEPTTIAPPPVVRTIPDEGLAQPVAPAMTENAAPRRAVKKAAPVMVAIAPKSAILPATDVVEAKPVVAEQILPARAAFEDSSVVTPVEQQADSQPLDDTNDNWMLFGGIAAALGFAGLGAGLAARRRRGRVTANNLPVLATPVPRPDYTAAPAMPIPAGFAPAQRMIKPSFATQHLPPVTDPLFTHKAVLEPITDPLFAHKAVTIPVTDPFFADHPDYVGRSSPFDTRRTWASGPKSEQPIVRELEPAE